MEAVNANDWGATIKNNHGSRKPGDFILFADDDNWYQPDALQTVRTVVQHDYDALYIFQMVKHMQPERFIPDLENNGEVELGNVDTGEALSKAMLCVFSYKQRADFSERACMVLSGGCYIVE